jgi:hypothetical protein
VIPRHCATSHAARVANQIFVGMELTDRTPRDARFHRDDATAKNRTIRSEEIGIPDPRKVFHSLRHTFKTALNRAGVPPFECKMTYAGTRTILQVRDTCMASRSKP